jgi:hypothetical protein
VFNSCTIRLTATPFHQNERGSTIKYKPENPEEFGETPEPPHLLYGIGTTLKLRVERAQTRGDIHIDLEMIKHIKIGSGRRLQVVVAAVKGRDGETDPLSNVESLILKLFDPVYIDESLSATQTEWGGGYSRACRKKL